MVIYICKNCNFKTNKKWTYDRHINRKFPCKNDINIGNEISKKKKIDDYSMTVDDSPQKIDDYSMTVDDYSMTVDDYSMTVDDQSKNNKNKYICANCNKKFKKKTYLSVHLKKYCNKNINNIYKFKKSTFGKHKYSSNSGDIYIIQTNNNFNNIFNIGKTTNIYNKLKDYRYNSNLEPRLYFYYPFKNIKKADNDIKNLIKNFYVKKNIYNCSISKLREIILNYQNKVDKCRMEYEPIIKDTRLYKCDSCNKILNNKTDMFSHLNKCENYKKLFINNNKVKINLIKDNEDDDSLDNEKISIFDSQKEDIFRKLLNEVNSLKEECKNLKSQVNCNNNNTTNNNYIQNNNFNLVAFGKEELNTLSNKTCAKLLNKGFMSIPALVEYVHFNKDIPEYNNVYISNMRDNYVMIYDGSGWKLEERQYIIDELLQEKRNYLIEKFDKLLSKLNNNVIKKFKRFLDNEEDNSIIRKIKKEIKLVLYNNNSLPLETKKLLVLKKN